MQLVIESSEGRKQTQIDFWPGTGEPMGSKLIDAAPMTKEFDLTEGKGVFSMYKSSFVGNL